MPARSEVARDYDRQIMWDRLRGIHARGRPQWLRKCVRCLRKASLCCAACAGAPRYASNNQRETPGCPFALTLYCSLQCKTDAWPLHQRVCLSRDGRALRAQYGTAAPWQNLFWRCDVQRREFRLHESAVISVTPARAQSIGFQARSELVWQLQSPFFLAEHDKQTRELRAALVCIKASIARHDEEFEPPPDNVWGSQFDRVPHSPPGQPLWTSAEAADRTPFVRGYLLDFRF